jgi:peptidoglycan/LPS O-acetylase OafA/YrhL
LSSNAQTLDLSHSDKTSISIRLAKSPQMLPLTGLRFFLAFWVVSYHQLSPESFSRSWDLSKLPFLALPKTGYVAVGVFFTLSGFILAYSYSLANAWKLGDYIKFAIARFARIYPIYLLGLLLMLPFQARWLLTEPVKAGSFALLQLSLLQSWLPEATLTWNSPGWSLSDEAFFYALFPLLGIAIWHIARLRTLFALGGFLWILAMLAPAISVWHNVAGVNISSLAVHERSFWLDLLRFDPLLRLPEFLIGIISCRIYLAMRSKWTGRGQTFYVTGGLLYLAAILSAVHIPYLVLHNGFLAPASALLIIGLALGGGAVATFLSRPTVVFLGAASYSMYIIHYPVHRWLEYFHWHHGIGPSLVYFALVIITASLAFHFVEEPMSRIVRSRARLLTADTGTNQEQKAAASAGG